MNILIASTAAAGIFESLSDGEEREIVVETLTDALKYVWILYTAVAGVGFFVSLTLKDLRLGDADKPAVEEGGQGHEEKEV